MKLEISVYCVPSHDHIQTLDFAIDNHFNSVELWDLNLFSPSMEELKRIKKAGIDISLHAPLINIGNEPNFKANVKLLGRTILNTKSWRAKIIVLHGGILSLSTNPGSSLQVAKSLIQKNLKKLERTGIYLCIENTEYTEQELFQRFAQLWDFVDAFPKKHVGVAFDISHAEITEGIQNGISIFSERIKHMHISDAKPVENISHLPIGNGNIDFTILRALPLDCSAILEIKPDENWKQNILYSRRFLQEKKLDR